MTLTTITNKYHIRTSISCEASKRSFASGRLRRHRRRRLSVERETLERSYVPCAGVHPPARPSAYRRVLHSRRIVARWRTPPGSRPRRLPKSRRPSPRYGLRTIRVVPARDAETPFFVSSSIRRRRHGVVASRSLHSHANRSASENGCRFAFGRLRNWHSPPLGSSSSTWMRYFVFVVSRFRMFVWVFSFFGKSTICFLIRFQSDFYEWSEGRVFKSTLIRLVTSYRCQMWNWIVFYIMKCQLIVQIRHWLNP